MTDDLLTVAQVRERFNLTQPAITKAIQASGRVIRSPTDEGIVVFLDKRYTWDNYRNCFPKGFAPIVTEEPEKYIKTFWEKD